MMLRTYFGLRIADCGLTKWEAIRGFSRILFRIPHSSIRNRNGFTYLALLVMITIMGILLGAAGKYWSFVSAREKEEELLFRGNQYRTAIERYATALPGRNELPPTIEALLKDNRSPTGKRHLRQQYKDPVTGEDFIEIRDKLRANRIVGVKSSSDRKPIKQKNFPDLYREFEGKEKYSEWEFKYLPVQAAPLLPQAQQQQGQHR